MLGVAADASHDEVRRAYTARALRLHPDRHGDATPGELEAAEWKMKELNAAWAVLRDPDRRRAYDREVGASRPPTGRPAPAAGRPGAGAGSRAGGGAGSVGGMVDDDLPRPEPDDDATAGVGHGGPDRLATLIRFAPLVVILVVLAAILVLSAVVAPDPDDDPDVVTTEAAPVGSCVQVQPAVSEEPGEPAGTPFVVEVDCAQPNSGRVVDKVPFPTPCPPGTVNVPVPADGISLCLQPPR